MSRRKRVIGYLRVSTHEQAQQGYGLDAQEDAIRGYCRARGEVRLVRLLRDEGSSGSNGLDQRRGLAEALALIEAGEASGLVVAKLDRLARDLLLQEATIARLREAGGEVFSVTEEGVESDEPTRVLVRQLLGAVAQYERALIRGRMLAGKQAKRVRGGWVGGGHPYGTQSQDRTLVPDPQEMEAVELIRCLRRDGLSYRAICVELERRGVRPRRADRWAPMTVRNVALR